MRVYVSGPIGGKPNGNREQFAHYEKLFRAAGYDVVNPHDVSPDHEGPCHGKDVGNKDHRYGCFLLSDIKVIATCDAIFMMPGWQTSPGAKAESAYAAACGLLFVRLPVCECDCHQDQAVAWCNICVESGNHARVY